MHEEHMTDEQALWFPLAKGLVILTAARERLGINEGHSFVDHAIDRAKRTMKHWLLDHYDIV